MVGGGCSARDLRSIWFRVQVANNKVLGFWGIVIIVWVLGKYLGCSHNYRLLLVIDCFTPRNCQGYQNETLTVGATHVYFKRLTLGWVEFCANSNFSSCTS